MSKPHAARLPENMSSKIKELAEAHNTTESAVIRAVIDTGLRARKWDEFQITPKQHEQKDAVEQAQQR